MLGDTPVDRLAVVVRVEDHRPRRAGCRQLAVHDGRGVGNPPELRTDPPALEGGRDRGRVLLDVGLVRGEVRQGKQRRELLEDRGEERARRVVLFSALYGGAALGVLPFAAMFSIVARTPFAAWLPRVLAVTLVALTSVFAVIGLFQRATHRLFYAPNLEVDNAFTSYFRVSSVFKDPSLFGRYLALGAAVVVSAYLLGRIRLAVPAPVLALAFAALWFSYSQSSMVTIFVVVTALALAAGVPVVPIVAEPLEVIALAGPQRALDHLVLDSLLVECLLHAPARMSVDLHPHGRAAMELDRHGATLAPPGGRGNPSCVGLREPTPPRSTRVWPSRT